MAAKHTLLLVDDEEDILQALRTLLARADREVILAGDAPAALREFEQKEIALIISAQGMPGVKGVELLAHVRERAPHCLRMLMTGRSNMAEAVAAINEGGIARYITKPWNDEEVEFAVGAALEHYDLEVRNRELAHQLAEQNKRLEDFNAALEHEVSERTRALDLKIKELQGRDRIAQHMLALHSIEETLDLVLEVINQIVKLDRAIVYLIGDNGIEISAAIGLEQPGQPANREQLQQLVITPIHHSAFKAVQESREPINIEKPTGHPLPPFAVVPIARGEELLGFIEVANPQSLHPVAAGQVKVVASFALQAAMAISEAQVHRDMSTWRGQLDQLMRDVAMPSDISD